MKKFKNTHAMSLKKRLDLKKLGYEGELRIKDTERASNRPFGHIDNRGRFKFAIEKVPFYNIPDLTGFQLMPYVSHQTPRLEYKNKVHRRIDLDADYLEQVKKRIEDQISGGIVLHEDTTSENAPSTGPGRSKF